MTKPRCILPGKVYLVTRRCRDRRFYLRPDPETNRAFNYCLAIAAMRFGVGVIAFVASSNHWHGVLVDRHGNLPDFLQFFHLMLAKHQNCFRGRWENMWSAHKTSVVELVDPEDIIEKIAYVLANPAKDHLVGQANWWPGASAIWALRKDFAIQTKRPKHFFDKSGRLQEEVTLELCLPPHLEGMPREEYVALINAAVERIEREAASTRAKLGIEVMGRDAI